MASGDEEIIKAVETWRQVYEATDPKGLKNLWCRDDRKVSYLPTESATILRSMAEIDAYYDRVCEALTDLGSGGRSGICLLTSKKTPIWLSQLAMSIWIQPTCIGRVGPALYLRGRQTPG